MTTIDVPLPQLSMGMADAEVVEWHVIVGDVVDIGDPIVDVDTGKVTAEIAAPAVGTIVELVVAAGDEVEIGATLCRIKTS